MEEKDKEVEIDLLELGRKLWANKKFIIKVTIIGAIIGLVIAFSIPKEYTGTVVFTTNSNDAKTGSMGALASLAGINLNNQTSESFSPELYPDIIGSTPFVKALLDINVEDRTQKINTTLYSYIRDDQKKAWWSYILKMPQMLYGIIKSDSEETSDLNENRFFISKEELDIIDDFKKIYNINTDKKTGITVFEITTQSSTISALLADTITSYLQSYIIQERTKKSQTDLKNSRKLYTQYKKNYDDSQLKLALFTDRNKNIISESYRFNQRKLENETNLAFSVYNQMAQQVQMNEIKVQDDTPVFTIIQPAVEQLYPSGPNKKIILVAFILLSFIGACGWILGKNISNNLKTTSKYNEKSPCNRC